MKIQEKMAAVAAAQKNREMFAIKKSYSIEVSQKDFILKIVLIGILRGKYFI